MKKALLLFLLLLSHHCIAQNYQCLQSGVKHYFTNGNGYLRGIRIDSTRIFGDTIVYYPFHTPRGNYYSSGGNVLLDSTGGSWLGKKVLQLHDGTFVFDDNWGDSVIIKTQANLSDSWIFYRDTSSVYYKATVISIDTVTLSGFFDTTKDIQINAYNGTALVTSDPANGLHLILSKNQGFLQVCDLYTFPYHLPNASFPGGLDYYMDKSIFGAQYPIPNLSSGWIDQNALRFNIVPFVSPSISELYSWHVGDVYEYSSCNGLIEYPTAACDPVFEYSLDTINTTSIVSGITSYGYSGWEATYTGADYITYPTSGTLSYGPERLIDTVLMPEEFGHNYIYYYLPNDSSFCDVNILYGIATGNLNGPMYVPPFEAPVPVTTYKAPLGLLHYNAVGLDGGFVVSDKMLIHYSRSGQNCGNYLTLSVPKIDRNSVLQIFPNPATTNLTIS